MSSGTLRLFVAASLPEDHLDWVASKTSSLRERWPEARWTKTENQHVTLKFLGSVPSQDLDEAISACRAATRVEPATIRLDRLGAFPNARRARVLWIGLDDPAGVLSRLAAGLDRAFEPLGIAAEKRAFSPHLTLARFKVPRALGDLPGLDDPPQGFRLDEVVLWRSHLSPRGATYEALEGFPLVPPHAA